MGYVNGYSIWREIYLSAFELENMPENKLPPIMEQHMLACDQSGLYI